ncbi:MAG TPA: histidine phosphatase family protein [Clostridiaceae bacterium]|nr:histidine phosphatase family protein [Clostridiaceae bacterium]
MSDTTRIYLTRHGKTYLNARKIMQGLIDSELSEQGMEEAERLAAQLADLELDAVYTSDLKRAAVTAEIVAAGQKNRVPVIKDLRLREINSGQFQGLSYEECARLDPLNWELAETNPLEYHPPGGEPGLLIQQRMQKAFDEIVEKYPGGKVLVVSHGFSIKAALYPYRRNKVSATDCITPRPPGQAYAVLPNVGLLLLQHHPSTGFSLMGMDK